MSNTLRLYAGECTARFTPGEPTADSDSTELDPSAITDWPSTDDRGGRLVTDGSGERVHRGRVVTLIKPDDTVLVHDADGYKPVAWLTRPESLQYTGGEPFGLLAADAGDTLRVRSERDGRWTNYAVTQAGEPVGSCPDCAATLVVDAGAVRCLGCTNRYPLPAGARVVGTVCDCGLPRMVVERGETFRVCVDAGCEPLHDAVRTALDGRFDCPTCGESLRVRRHRGRSYLACDDPDCETTFSIPRGRIVGDCDCGLPRFQTPTTRRCLDGTCDHDE